MRFLPNVDYYVDEDGVLHVSIDGKEIGTVAKGEKKVFPIERDCLFSVRFAGINFITEQRLIRAGKRTVIKIKYNQLTGKAILSEE